MILMFFFRGKTCILKSIYFILLLQTIIVELFRCLNMHHPGSAQLLSR